MLRLNLGGIFHVADRLGDSCGRDRHGLRLLQYHLGCLQDLRVLVDGRFSQLLPQGRIEGIRVHCVLLKHHRGRLIARKIVLEQGLQSLIAVLDRGTCRVHGGGGGPGGEGSHVQGEEVNTRSGLAA